MAPFEPLAFQADNAHPEAMSALSFWRNKLPWILVATLLHIALLAGLAIMPGEPLVQPPRPLAVSLLPPTPQQEPVPPKPQPQPPQPRIEKRQAPTPQIPVMEKPVATALTTQAPPPPQPPAVEAPPEKARPAPAQAAPQPVVQPQFDAAYLNNPKPEYPRLSRRLGETGKVFLRVHVLADGNPDQVELRTSSGFARLDNAAQEAVKHWRFIPAKQGSEAIAAWIIVPLTFSLEN